jgi:hypothetical protein
VIAVVIHKSDDLLGQLAATGLYVRPSCVTIDTHEFPAMVKLDDWRNTTVTLRGTKNCAADVDLYVTFVRDYQSDRLLY